MAMASAGPFAPHCREIITSAPHHLIFFRSFALPAAQSTVNPATVNK